MKKYKFVTYVYNDAVRYKSRKKGFCFIEARNFRDAFKEFFNLYASELEYKPKSYYPGSFRELVDFHYVAYAYVEESIRLFDGTSETRWTEVQEIFF